MLKKRIIPMQLLMNDRLVKTTKFDHWRDVGDPVKSSLVYNSTYADELIFLNISRENRTISSLRSIIERVSEVSFMPICMGGGITSFDDAAELIRTGADKIVINSEAYRDRSILSETAATFGSQAVVVSIDARWNASHETYDLFSDCGRRQERLTLEQHIYDCVAAGAGELVIQSMDRDGTMAGYDFELIRRAKAVATVPIIAAGGSGNYEHLRDVFLETDVSAVACGSLFNFSDSNPMRAKSYLSNYGLNFKVV